MTAAIPDATHADILRGARFAILSAAAFALTGACIKAASAAGVGNEQVVFFRNIVALVVLSPWLLRRGLSGLHTQHFGGHLWRSCVGLGAMYCFFFAIGHMPLANAMLEAGSRPRALNLALLRLAHVLEGGSAEHAAALCCQIGEHARLPQVERILHALPTA